MGSGTLPKVDHAPCPGRDAEQLGSGEGGIGSGTLPKVDRAPCPGSNAEQLGPQQRIVGQVLLLDADNQPLRNPEPLFDAEAFRSTGGLFWPDWCASLRASQPALHTLRCMERDAGMPHVGFQTAYAEPRLASRHSIHIFNAVHVQGGSSSGRIPHTRMRTCRLLWLLRC